jgi:hypothetical protein
VFLLLKAAHAQEVNVLTTKEKAQGYELLFDGKAVSPDIWQDEKSIDGYPVENGVIVCRKGGNLLTKKEYGDFIFRFEFKLPPGGNNGVGIRAESVNKDAAYNGMEIQILDNTAEQYQNLRQYQAHGSIYGVVPAKRNAEKNDYQKPVGEWNVEEITAKGSKIKVVLNGETIVDADIAEFKTKPTLDGQEHPGLHREKGFVGFLGHNDPVEFRNIRIKSLDGESDQSGIDITSRRKSVRFAKRLPAFAGQGLRENRTASVPAIMRGNRR